MGWSVAMFTSAAGVVVLLTVGQVGPLAHRMTLSDGLDSPAAVAVTTGEILVVDPRLGVIRRFALDGTPIGAWPEPGGPVGIASHPDGRIIVSRRLDAKVAIYDNAFNFDRFLGDGLVAFVEPTDLAIDPGSGRIYVVDSGADRVHAFDTDGTLAWSVGVRGAPNGQFKHPSAIAVDAANHRVVVADQDNFRVQVFSDSGLFLFRFGYRIKFLPGGSSEGWFPRTSGLAVDATGRIYVTDAAMGTLRIFTPAGAELGKVVSYGSGPGQLQTPQDVAFDTLGRVLVANGNVGTVEVYDAPGLSLESIAPLYFEGVNESVHDATPRDLRARLLAKSFENRGGGSRSSGTVAAASTWDPPHTLTDTICGRCHDIDAEPGGHEATVAGQTNLCLSCHISGGHAAEFALRAADRVLVGAPPPTSGGRSHAWDVPAVNAAVGSEGPPAGSEVARHLTGGLIKCATCHEQHSNDAGSPYLRMSNLDGALCKQCHVDYIGHTPHGSWQPTCSECHDLHNPHSGNLALMATAVNNRTLGINKGVVFTAETGAGSFNDGDPAANDGICQVCHTATAYHRHDGTGVSHHPGERCVDCHPHGAGFLPTGGDCTACHAAPQDNGDGVPVGGRRAVVGEFPVGDAHAHYGAQLDSAACVVCHDQTTHMDGNVDLLDPDTGAFYTFQRPDSLAHDPDVSDFCANCHDDDGARRLAAALDPFGQGNAPPDVAGRFRGTLQWEEAYGDVCFGTEGTLRGVNSHHDIGDADQAFSGAKIECLNCHGAHSPSRNRPLADPFAPTTAWTGDANGFCLSCHGGGSGPLDPGFPAGVFGPVIDVTDPRWVALGMNWSTILGGACIDAPCSSIRGIDSCDYGPGPWYVDYSWTHSAHGLDSKRAWPGYSGAPGAAMDCMTCHDPHGSYSATNPTGNPYAIRDFVDGTAFVDDGTRTGGVVGPPWTLTGAARAVTVPVAGADVGWGATDGLCQTCHATWRVAYDFHDFCTSCQTCHGHGMTWGEADWVGFDDDTPCPVPGPSPASLGTRPGPARGQLHGWESAALERLRPAAPSRD